MVNGHESDLIRIQVQGLVKDLLDSGELHAISLQVRRILNGIDLGNSGPILQSYFSMVKTSGIGAPFVK